MDFLMTEDTRAHYSVPFAVSKTNWKQLAKVVSITMSKRVEQKYKLKQGVTLPKGENPDADQVEPSSVRGVIQIEFQSPDGFYSHIEDKWDNANSKPENMARSIKMLNQQLAHIAVAISEDENFVAKYTSNIADFKKFVDETYGDSGYNYQWRYLEYFVHCCNTCGHNNGPIWLDVNGNSKRLQIKLTRIPVGKSVNNLQLGKGNCIEIYKEGGKSTLAPLSDEHFDMIDVAATTVAAQTKTAPGIGSTQPAEDVWPTDI
jgi:hypothetical protein